jgi:hypothetical protein
METALPVLPAAAVVAAVAVASLNVPFYAHRTLR